MLTSSLRVVTIAVRAGLAIRSLERDARSSPSSGPSRAASSKRSPSALVSPSDPHGPRSSLSSGPSRPSRNDRRQRWSRHQILERDAVANPPAPAPARSCAPCPSPRPRRRRRRRAGCRASRSRRTRGVCDRNFSMIRSFGEPDDPLVGPGHAGVARGRPSRPAGSVSSAVGTWVCVPRTADTRPSRYQPIAAFSEVASAWMSTTMTFSSGRRAPAPRRPTRNGESALRRHEDLPLQVQDADRNPGGASTGRSSPARGCRAGSSRGAGGGPDAFERVVDLLLVPDVVARGEDVDRQLRELREELDGQAEAARRRSRR